MSLINQVLQDLDARRAAHGVGSTLPNDVRPLPKSQRTQLPMILAIVVLLVLAGGLAAYHWEMRQDAAQLATPGIPAAVATTEVTTVSPAAPAPLARAQQEPLQSPPPAAANVPDSGDRLRHGDPVTQPTEQQKGAQPASDAAVGEKSAATDHRFADDRGKGVVAEQPLPAAAGLAPQGAGKSTTTPVIERTEASGSPRERAESDYRKALAKLEQGRIAEAMEGLRHALWQDPLHGPSRQVLVRLLLDAKRPDEAALVLQEGLPGQPGQIGWAMTLARLQVDRGDLAGAAQTLDHTLPAAAGNADYQGFMAHVLQRLGRNSEAAEHYQAATRLAPGDGRWWLGLGLVLEADGRSAEARAALLRAKSAANLSAELAALVEQKLR